MQRGPEEPPREEAPRDPDHETVKYPHRDQSASSGVMLGDPVQQAKDRSDREMQDTRGEQEDALSPGPSGRHHGGSKTDEQVSGSGR
jgi:hypothetical protein